jgi:hypothetical protein
MYDYTTFKLNDKQEYSNFFIFGTCDLTVDNTTKNVKVALIKEPTNFNGGQPFMQTALCEKELVAVLEDGSIVEAEYREYLGSKPVFSDKHNSRNPKQKKVLKYSFRSSTVLNR